MLAFSGFQMLSTGIFLRLKIVLSPRSFPLPVEGALLQRGHTELHGAANQSVTARYPRRKRGHHSCLVSMFLLPPK